MVNPYIHLVSFGLKEGINPAYFFKLITNLYESMIKQGVGILALETATHDNTEIPNNNLHYFRMVFASKEDFSRYLIHPEHKDFETIALENLVLVDSIKITNTTAKFRIGDANPAKPENRPRSASAP